VRRIARSPDLAWQPLPPDRTAAFWGVWRAVSQAGDHAPARCAGRRVDDAIDLLSHDLDEHLLSAGAGSGMIADR